MTVEEEAVQREAAMNPPDSQSQTLPPGQEPQLALVKGRHTGLLKGAPETVKQLYSAK